MLHSQFYVLVSVLCISVRMSQCYSVTQRVTPTSQNIKVLRGNTHFTEYQYESVTPTWENVQVEGDSCTPTSQLVTVGRCVLCGRGWIFGPLCLHRYRLLA